MPIFPPRRRGAGGSSSAHPRRACLQARGVRDRRGFAFALRFSMAFHPLNGFRFFNARKKVPAILPSGVPGLRLTPAECVQFVRTKVARLSKQRPKPSRCFPARRDAPARSQHEALQQRSRELLPRRRLSASEAAQHPRLLGKRDILSAAAISDQISSSAREKSKLVVKLQNFRRSRPALVSRALRPAAATPQAEETFPPQFFSTIAAVRLARFPRAVGEGRCL